MKRIQLSVLGILVLVGCAASHDKQRCKPAAKQVVHVIVCWLKTPGDAVARQLLIDTTHGFEGKIPSLVCVRVGTALPSTRPSVDSTFDVAAMMIFTDESALAEYGKNPIHQQAIRDVLKPLVDHYMIYDFVDR